MTAPTISCEQFADGLPDLLEREVDERTRARLEAHALSCGECGPLLADLRKLSTDAAALPELVPSRDLWAGVESRIETPVVEIPMGGRVDGWNGGKQRRRLTPVWMGLAAAGLVALTATITHQVTKRAVVAVVPAATVAERVATLPPAVVTTPGAGVAGVSSAAQSNADRDSVPGARPSSVPASSTTLASNKTRAEQAYDAEVARLRAIVKERRTVLDTATVSVIERNLKVIDDAIAQCRDALRKDPASQFLVESLNDALETKIKLLRTAATLPARS
jgi:hypothetical protein